MNDNLEIDIPYMEMNEEERNIKIMNDGKNAFIQMIRIKRDAILFDTDKYLLPDFPITNENLNIIKDYRQQLRDYNNNSNNSNLILPDKPDFIKNTIIYSNYNRAYYTY
jgi:hypothetical protein